jgi:hypothetical protein
MVGGRAKENLAAMTARSNKLIKGDFVRKVVYVELCG